MDFTSLICPLLIVLFIVEQLCMTALRIAEINSKNNYHGRIDQTRPPKNDLSLQ